MPSIEEWLDGVVEYSQRMLAIPCPACDGSGSREHHHESPCVCPLCNGEDGRRQDCGLCRGSGEWKEWAVAVGPCGCDNGIARVERFSAMEQTHVLNACVGAMISAREEGNFDRMNRVMDWANAYCLQGAAAALEKVKDDPNMKDDLEAALQRGGEVVPKERGVRFKPSPLTPEELAELGLEVPEAE